MSMSLNRGISYEKAWKSFSQVNWHSVFQTALLLSADVHVAEEALANGVGDLDLSKPPERHNLAIWERTVVKRSIEIRALASLEEGSMARSMLQPGLWPVIEIQRCPRICFVLRVLLGCAAVFCAQMPGIAESEIQTQLEKALTQLCNIKAAA